ncbi:MAG: hypothetical protein RR461_11200 [Angelakisella sp.]
MKAKKITYSKDMTSGIARVLLRHKDDILKYARDHPEEYAKFCEEWDRTHGKEVTSCIPTEPSRHI